MKPSYCATLHLVILALAVLVAVGCESDGDAGAGGSETGAIGACDTDPSAHSPTSGGYEGRFAFSTSDPVTFPLELNIDLNGGTVRGTLGFRDAVQSYSGTMEPARAGWRA